MLQYESVIDMCDDLKARTKIGCKDSLWHGCRIKLTAKSLTIALSGLFDVSMISKWDFYPAIAELHRRRWVTLKYVSQVSGIKLSVLKMRMAQLRGMKNEG